MLKKFSATQNIAFFILFLLSAFGTLLLRRSTQSDGLYCVRLSDFRSETKKIVPKAETDKIVPKADTGPIVRYFISPN